MPCRPASLLLCLVAGPALAGPPCGPRDRVVAHLGTAYAESPRAMGLAQNGVLMEVFAADGSGTWTVTITGPDGTTCLVAAGDRFEMIAPPPARPGRPA